MRSSHPLVQLTLTRMRQFFREPEAIFWTYGFPVLMVVGLGMAFRSKPPDRVAVGVATAGDSAAVEAALTSARVTAVDGSEQPRFDVVMYEPGQHMDLLRKSRVTVAVEPRADGSARYLFDPTHPESLAARAAVDDCLQRERGRADAVATVDEALEIPGSRYVDFLVPGLIAMNLMSGGMWGIGFVLVDMRVRNLLKRLVATPMRRRDFLLSMIGVRALFFVPEMLFLIIAAYFVFEVKVAGSLMGLLVVGFIGAVAFAGLGLLTACRAQRLETVSGLMNVIMLPMWLMSGVFFSSERFPDALQPLIQALPLTQLINALRAIAIDGSTVASQAVAVGIVALWGAVSFALALRWFRWQ